MQDVRIMNLTPLTHTALLTYIHTGKGVEYSPDHRCTTALMWGILRLTPTPTSLSTPLFHSPGPGGVPGVTSAYSHTQVETQWERKLIVGWLISSLALTSPPCSLDLFCVVFTPGKHLPLQTGSYYLCHTEAVNTTLTRTVLHTSHTVQTYVRAKWMYSKAA